MPSQKSAKSAKGWKDLYAEVSKRISDGVWKPGEFIPKEVDLSEEFDCARGTVNRALRELAKEGFLDRRRKAGTRVALHPVRKATLDISITRREVEQRGHAYAHEVLERKQKRAPIAIKKKLGDIQSKPLYLATLHKADQKPFLYETRWINTEVTPQVLNVDFCDVSANEWLVNNALFTTGEITFSAVNATSADASILNIDKGRAIFVIERTTWIGDDAITTARLAYAPNFKISTQI